MSLCIPTRIFHFFKCYYNAFTHEGENSDLFYLYELRFGMWKNIDTYKCKMYLINFFFFFFIIIINNNVKRICAKNSQNYINDDYHALRGLWIANLMLGVGDCFVIPQIILGFFMPTRTYHFIQMCFIRDVYIHTKKKKKQWKEASKNPEYLGDPQLGYNIKYRLVGIRCLWIGLFDLVFLCCGFLSVVVMPIRIFGFVRAFRKHWKTYKEDNYGDLRLALLINLLMAFLEWLFVICALPLLIMITRYYHMYKLLHTVFTDNSEQNQHKRLDPYPLELKYYLTIRLNLLANLCPGIFDWFVLLCGILSVVIMPFRLVAFCRCFYIHWDSYKNDNYNVLREALMMNLVFGICDWLFVICAIPLLIMLTRYYHIAKLIQQNWQRKDMERERGNIAVDLGYNSKIRWNILSNLFPGIADWIALLFGILSMVIMPLRVIAVVRTCRVHWEAYKNDKYLNLRLALMMNLWCACYEWLFILFAFPLVLVISRYYHIFEQVREALNDTSVKGEQLKYRNFNLDLRYNSQLRVTILSNFGPGLADWFALLCGILSMIVMPLRAVAFFRSFYVHWDDYKKDQYVALRSAMLRNLLFAICEWVFILCAIPLIFMPSRHYHIFKKVNEAWNDTNEESQNKRFGSFRKDLRYDTTLRWEILSNIFPGFLDWFVLLCGILSIIVMPFRLVAFFRSIYVHWDDYKNDKYSNLREALVMNLIFACCEWLVIIHAITLVFAFSRYFHIYVKIKQSLMEGNDEIEQQKYGKYRFDLRYNKQLRWVIVTNVYFGIFDLFILLCGILSVVIMPFRLFAFVRTIHIHWQSYKNDDYVVIRVAMLLNLIYACYEWIFIILAIPVLLMFTRYYHIVKKIQKAMKEDNDQIKYGKYGVTLRYDTKLRLAILYDIFPGLLDWIVLFCGILSILIMPLRFKAFIRCIRVHWDAYKNDNYSNLRISLTTNLFLSLLEWIFIIIALPLLILFSRYYHVYKRIQEARIKPTPENEKQRYGNYPIELRYDVVLRWGLLANIIPGLLDYVILLFGIFSVIVMPFRVVAFFRCFYVHWDNYKKDQYDDLRLALLTNLWYSICECCFILAVLPLFFMFTRYFHVIKCIQRALHDTTEEGQKKRFGYYYKDLKYDTVLRWEVLSNLLPGLFDLVALLCGIMSVVIMPFRLAALFRSFKVHWEAYKKDQYNDLREALMVNVGFSICEWLFILCAIPLLLIPSRYYHIFSLIKETIKDQSEEAQKRKYGAYSKDLRYDSPLRWSILMNLFPGIGDWFVLLFGILAVVIMPLRVVAFVRSISVHWESYKKDDYDNLRKALVMNLWFAICEWIFFVCAIPLVFMFTRYYHMIDQIKRSFGDQSEAAQKEKYGDYEKDLKYNTKLRLKLLSNILVGFVDLIALLLGILSVVIMPFRLASFLRAIRVNWDAYKKDDYYDLRVLMLSNLLFACLEWLFILCALPLVFMWSRYFHVWKEIKAAWNDTSEEGEKKRFGQFRENLRYDSPLRWALLSNVIPGFMDWIAFLMGLLAVILCPFTRLVPFVRSFTAFKEDYQNDKYEEWRIACLVSLPLAVFDALALVTGFIALFSIIRTPWLIRDLRQHSLYKNLWSSLKDPINWQLRYSTYRNFVFVFVDFVFLLMFLVCLCSVYRAIKTIILMYDTKEWTDDRMNVIRYSIFTQFFNLLIDIVIFSWCFVIVAITVYRFIPWCLHISHSWRVFLHNRRVTLANESKSISKKPEENAIQLTIAHNEHPLPTEG
ncbi:F-box domain containing protein [Reticulomyxa filosa]|uniref:F-box domain containing protein n=1 Tax=Reticulomyxa filosa TaxID=46433 RepID=X6LV52_RETFI|nr:F-box domain containing protein [Reticulomyxa filosa]|eukprot:ETO05484.1 F-box domain containing protein [Reticulomyxa filosa]